jgi:glycosyltransferase involved in cell wall biosynthesis
MPIVLAGKPQNAQERAYFSSEIAPLINGKDVLYVGPVGSIAKRELLRRAAALVFPIAGDEAFGLAMIEAMACGTPVLARRHSSAPEIVDHGVTGFVEDSVEELAARVSDAMQLDRRRLRQAAAARFGHRRMVDEYLAAYYQLLAQHAGSAEGTSPLLPTRTSHHTRTTPGGGQ